MTRTLAALVIMIATSAVSLHAQNPVTQLDSAGVVRERLQAAADRLASAAAAQQYATGAGRNQLATLTAQLQYAQAGLRVPRDAVSYTISGTLDPSRGAPLPIEIVTALRGDSHLKSMNVSSESSPQARFSVDGVLSDGETGPVFSAFFGFATVEEFHDWYADRGADLHRALETATTQDVRFNLSIVPSPETF